MYNSIDSYSTSDVFELLCTMRRSIQNADHAESVMKGMDCRIQMTVLDIERTITTAEELRRFLKPVTIVSQSDEGICFENRWSLENGFSSLDQDSVCRLLMRVDLIQQAMIQFVLSKITEYSDEDGGSNSIISLLLNQFRWLDFVSDCSTLVSGLLETLSVIHIFILLIA